MENQTKDQKVVSFVTSEHVDGCVELLKRCRTQLSTVLADTEFQTVVNALTLEVESNLIQRMLIEVDRIKNNGIINE